MKFVYQNWQAEGAKAFKTTGTAYIKSFRGGRPPPILNASLYFSTLNTAFSVHRHLVSRSWSGAAIDKHWDAHEKTILTCEVRLGMLSKRQHTLLGHYVESNHSKKKIMCFLKKLDSRNLNDFL